MLQRKMLFELRRCVDYGNVQSLTERMVSWSKNGNVFALKVAVEFQRISVVDVRHCFYEGMAAAVAAGKSHALEILIATGLNADYVSAQGSMVAIGAAHGHREIVELLVREYGANLNGRRSYPIHAAIWKQKPWRYLFDLGADINRKKKGQTPLMFALETAPTRYVIELAGMTGVDINEGDKTYQSPLERAAYEGRGHIGEILLDLGAKVDGEEVGSPLLGAIATCHANFVKRLLDDGANVGRLTEGLEGPLHLLFKQSIYDPEDQDKILKMLVAVGIDINETYESIPELHWQIQEAKECEWFDNHHEEPWFERVECLLRNGADVDKVDTYGNSALQLACELHHTSHRSILIDKLLQEQADVTIANDAGQTVLMSGHLSTGEVNKLVMYGAELDAVDVHGMSALHVAIFENNPSMAKALLKNGINASIRDRFEHTARFYVEPRDTEIGTSQSMASRSQLLEIFRRWERRIGVVWNSRDDVFDHRRQSAPPTT